MQYRPICRNITHLPHRHQLVPAGGREFRELAALHLPRAVAQFLCVTAAQAGLAIRASKAERKRVPSGEHHAFVVPRFG